MMTVTKIYVDLTAGEEKKAQQLKQDCQDIIDIVNTISVSHQDGPEFVVKLENILIKAQSKSSLAPQIRNLKSSIEGSIN